VLNLRTRSKQTTTASGYGLALVATAVLWACTSGAAVTESTSPSPSRSPSPTNSAPPASTPPTSSSPQATASQAQSPVPSAGGRFHVELANSAGKALMINVHDESGRLLAASSGTPGDGASVPQNTIVVANEGPATLSLTWAGPPCADADLLVIDATGASMILVQPECAGDAIAFDRVLILTFAEPVSAANVDAVIQAGGDTPG